MSVDETIVAPASAPGRAALALVRISGPSARPILGHLFRPHAEGTLEPRRARVGVLLDRGGEVIDECVALFWQGPASATGEDLAELSLHGSPALVEEAIAHACARGARLARPGEFTLRALESGKIDLARAEAIADLVDASTLGQARIAARQLRGEVGAALAPIAEGLYSLLADVEASLDFAEDEGLGISAAEIVARLDQASAALEGLAAASETAMIVREGARVVLLGPPNAGKSSLFNALLGRDRVIVSREPGTTRDTIEETTVIEGLPVVLVDGAGQGAPRGDADAEGMRRARDEASRADLVLDVYDVRSSRKSSEPLKDDRTIKVGTHADVCDENFLTRGSGCLVGTPTSQGIEELRLTIASLLRAPGSRSPESVALATRRHREAAARARTSLEGARRAASEGLEWVAVDLREALRALQEIVGEVTPEDLLGRIFTRFCIGK